MSRPWTDAPIARASEDDFGRGAYAAHAAALIASAHTWDDSVVLGLAGPWGSGKTSMIAMITEALKAAADPEWKVAHFTPWATSDVSGLLGDFYASLGSVLPPDRAATFRRTLGTLIRLAAPAASVIPVAGGVVRAGAQAAGDALTSTTSWHDAFEEAAEVIRSVGSPVLLIADDIDRLQSDELLALLKVVRLLGRFPGVHYLLAYDEATLFETLASSDMVRGDDGAARRFMEKVVQYPLAVPPLLRHQLIRRLDVGLDNVLAETSRPSLNSHRLGRLDEVFRSLLSTPRAIDRFLAQLRHHLPLVPSDEVDDEDVIILTLLRMSFPSLYADLPRLRDPLISGHTDEMKAKARSLEFESFDLDECLQVVPPGGRSDARELMHALFPALRRGASLVGANRARAVADSQYFDRYFAYGIPDNDIPDGAVRSALEDAYEGNSQPLAHLLLASDADVAGRVLDKAMHGVKRASDVDGQKRLGVLRVLVATLDDIIEVDQMFSNPRDRGTRWAASLLASLSHLASPYALNEVLDAAPTLVLRLQLILYAGNDGLVPPSLTEAADRAARECTAAFVANVCAGDDAPTQEPVGFYRHFLTATGRHQSLVTRLALGLTTGDFTVWDLGARFVDLRHVYGTEVGSLSINEVDQEGFNFIAPSADGDWFEEEPRDINTSDTSWRNRRAFAVGRLHRPDTGGGETKTSTE